MRSLAGRKQRKLETIDDLGAAEIVWMKDRACFLKAMGLSYRKISDQIGVTTVVVRGWFDDTELRDRVTTLQTDMVESAKKLAEQYSLEAMQILMSTARTAIARENFGDAIRASEGILDRVGLAKVNKSESKVTKETREEHDLSSGLFERLESLPIETQQELARLSAEMDALVQAAKGEE